jgi:hypothetical protein
MVWRGDENPTDSSHVVGLFCRYADTSNLFSVRVNLHGEGAGSGWAEVIKRVTGTQTRLAAIGEFAGVMGSTFLFPTLAETWYFMRLIAYANGVWEFWFGQSESTATLVFSGYDTALATGGALASGGYGIYDAYTGVASLTRRYDDFMVFVPTADAAMFAGQSLSLEHDRATRENSGGSFPVTISDRRGRYLKIPPAGPEGRSTRLVIMALPNDPYTAGDVAAIYDLSAQLHVTPRGLVVPEA